MSAHRVLLIESAAELSIDVGRLRIRRHGFDDTFISISDIAVACLHHYAIKLSNHVLQSLSAVGAVVIITDEYHHPSALLLPIAGTQEITRRLRQQVVLDASPNKNLVWQQLVQARLHTQAVNLRDLGCKGALRLDRLISQVQPGDVSKCEGQGAKHYWANIFPKGFKRGKQGAEDVINTRLNFGYAVLRAMVARGLVMAGLNPALGVGHANMENPFNLADDFIEPYRFLVERHVATMKDESDFDAQARKRCLGFMEFEVKMIGASWRLPAAITESVSSYVRILEGRRDAALVLPVGAVLKEAWA
jgi:CRISPR-associated protein Cas1